MILYCDEGVDRGIVDALRSDGHAVTYVAELEPGITDGEQKAQLVCSSCGKPMSARESHGVPGPGAGG